MLMDFLWNNREWLFSGLGVLVVGGVAKWLLGRASKPPRDGGINQHQSGGHGSTNVQIGSVDRGRD